MNEIEEKKKKRERQVTKRKTFFDNLKVATKESAIANRGNIVMRLMFKQQIGLKNKKPIEMNRNNNTCEKMN